MPTTEQTREDSAQALVPVPIPEFELSERDVRRKRPPVLAFLLRLDTRGGRQP